MASEVVRSSTDDIGQLEHAVSGIWSFPSGLDEYSRGEGYPNDSLFQACLTECGARFTSFVSKRICFGRYQGAVGLKIFPFCVMCSDMFR